MSIYRSSVLAAFLLAGCVSVLPEPKAADGLYRFGPMDAVHQIETDITVREPVASRLVGGRAIASEGRDGAIRFVPGVEWAESTRRMMQQALLDQLNGAGGSGTALPAGMSANGAYEVSWRISDFSLLGDTARCRLDVTLLDGRTRTPVVQRFFTADVDAASARNADRALALKAAGRACVSDVASFVAQKAVARDE